MTFVVMGLGTVFNALTNRRDPTSGLSPPILQALAISLVPVALIVLATQLQGLQAALLTAPLTGAQWLECVGTRIAAAPGHRNQQVDSPPTRTAVPAIDPQRAVTPSRALAGAPAWTPARSYRGPDRAGEQDERA